MKEQVVIRTYPYGRFSAPTETLEKYLASGYTVVMCNKFDVCSSSSGHPIGVQGNEYILEKQAN